MAYATVPTGPFQGWTKSEILARQQVLKAALKDRAPGMGLLTGATVNGQSFSYDVRSPGSWSIPEETALLQEAIAYVDDTAIPLTSQQTFSAR